MTQPKRQTWRQLLRENINLKRKVSRLEAQIELLKRPPLPDPSRGWLTYWNTQEGQRALARNDAIREGMARL